MTVEGSIGSLVEEIIYYSNEIIRACRAEDIALNSGASKDDVPEECLSPKERYENAVRKSCVYSQIVKGGLVDVTGLEDLG